MIFVACRWASLAEAVWVKQALLMAVEVPLPQPTTMP